MNFLSKMQTLLKIDILNVVFLCNLTIEKTKEDIKKHSKEIILNINLTMPGADDGT